MLRMMSLMAAMHLWELCTKGRGDSWGGERSSMLFFVMLPLVVVGVLVVIVLQKLQIEKIWGWDGSSNVRMLFEGDLASGKVEQARGVRVEN